MKHLGKLKNTDQRCVVVFMQLPEKPTHALIIPVDGLTPRIEQALMDVVKSKEAQAARDLAFVLERRLLPDTGQNMLMTLHNAGLLRDVPIEQVIMLPRPNMPFNLRDILEKMGGVTPIDPPLEESVAAATEKFNPHTANAQAQSTDERRGMALNLLRQANDLFAEAERKRTEAYRYAPELSPKVEAPPADGVKEKPPRRRRPKKEASA